MEMDIKDAEVVNIASKAILEQGYKLFCIESKVKASGLGFYAIEITANFSRKINISEKELKDFDALKNIEKAIVDQGYKLYFFQGQKMPHKFQDIEITAKFLRKIDCPENEGTIYSP